MKSKLPFILSTLGLTLGIIIAILFGVNEKIFKDKISNDLGLNQKIMKITDVEKKSQTIAKEKSKNWRYYQRYHFHATGIGAMSLAALFLFSFSMAPFKLRLLGSYMISVGGLLYPFVWLFTGIYGPSMGRTEAKEAFAVFGYMGGVSLLGFFLLLFVLFKYPLKLLKEEN